MKKYLMSFYWENNVNSVVSVAIRTKVEQLDPETWVQIFPNLLTFQSEIPIEDIYSEIASVSSDKRFIIVEADKFFTNETRSHDLLKIHNY